MIKRCYSATREPLDLDCFIANFIQDYENSDHLQIGQHQQALCPEIQESQAVETDY